MRARMYAVSNVNTMWSNHLLLAFGGFYRRHTEHLCQTTANRLMTERFGKKLTITDGAYWMHVLCTHFYSPPDCAAKLNDSEKNMSKTTKLIAFCLLFDIPCIASILLLACVFPRIHYKLFNDFNVFMTAPLTQYTRCRQHHHGFIKAFTVINIWLQDFNWNAKPLLLCFIEAIITLFFANSFLGIALCSVEDRRRCR